MKKTLSFLGWLLLVIFFFLFHSRLAYCQSGDPLPVRSSKLLVTGQAPVNGTNEIQTLTFGGTPTGGTFTLSFFGKTTAAITWSSTNGTLVSNIDTALEALATIGTGGVTTAVGTMTSGIGTITVTFTGNNAKLDVPLMVRVSSLTGTSPTLAVATTTAGVTADGRSQAQTGDFLVDIATPGVYINSSLTTLQPTWVPLVSVTASDLGLGNVNNTSDANKPVSTATQTALNLKANIASPTFTGTVTVPAAVVGTALPTSDPMVAGRIWVDTLTLKVSAGP